MTALFLSLLAEPTVLAIIAGLVGAFGWGWKQRRAGAAAERDRWLAEEAAARDIADEVDNDIGALPPDAARKELAQWAK